MNTKNINPVGYFFITLFFGLFGVHKFIDGKVGIGILYIFTYGLLCIGWIIDVIRAFIAIFGNNNSEDEFANNSNTTPSYNISDDNDITTTPIENTYIRTGNIISRADGKRITDEELPYLFESTKADVLEYEKNSTNPKFHRTVNEDELSFRFINSKNYNLALKEIDFFEKVLLHEKSFKDLDIRIRLLQEALVHYNKAKSICYKTKGGTIWFQDMYEYCHNSKSGCFSFEDKINERIKYNQNIINALPVIMEIISDNNGYYQKDLKNILQIEETVIRQAVKYLVENGQLIKSKKNNCVYLQTTLSTNDLLIYEEE